MATIISFPRTNEYDGQTVSTVDRVAGVRYGNASKPRMEIRYGDDSVYKLDKVIVDYLKTPQTVKLTQDQLDSQIDTSQILEFPDYVCNEIVNELVRIIMENAGDQRIKTQPLISESIAVSNATQS